MRRVHLLLASIAMAMCLVPITPVMAQPVIPSLWAPDNTVWATAVSGNTLYLGGVFRSLGRETGGGAVLDTGLGELIATSPVVHGIVRAVTPDGAGGWFVGGEFDTIGGIARQNLARLDASLGVTAWNPGANQPVYSLARAESTLYVGGAFTTCGGATRNRIAALHATTGEVRAWNPLADDVVRSIVLDGTTVYVGGAFSTIGGASRRGVAALSASTGLATSWDPGTDPGTVVHTLVLKGTTVFVGGAFSNMGGQPRQSLAEVRLSNARATAWDPAPSSDVLAMVLDGATLYVGGRFENIGGQARSRLAALSAADGLATAWDPSIGPLGDAATSTDALALAGGTLHVGGHFSTVGGQARRCLAGLDLATGSPTPWSPGAEPASDATLFASAIAVSGSAVYVGGSFQKTGLASRDYLAAIDLTTGAPTSWRPQPDGFVRCIAASGSKVFVGGDFLQVGGAPHARLAAIDGTTGVPDAWDAASDNLVTAVAVDGGTIFAGGNFTTIGGQVRRNLAALDASTGIATGWDPPDGFGGISTIVPSGNTVYVGGSRGSNPGPPRSGAAALDRTSASVLPWDPDVRWSIPGELPVVADIAIGPDAVYLGGYFDRVGGLPRARLAAVDPTTGLPTPWDPGVIGEVHDLEWIAPNLFVAGGFSSIGGVPRTSLAALDPLGTVLPWNPTLGGGQVLAISPAGPNLCIGGSFSTAEGNPSPYLAVLGNPVVLDAPPIETLAGPLVCIAIAPHPLASAGTVRFTLRKPGLTTLGLFDVAGRRVRQLMPAQPLEAGVHELRIERGALPDGLYLLRLGSGAETVTKKLVLSH